MPINYRVPAHYTRCEHRPVVAMDNKDGPPSQNLLV
jgi:hypothetical protein